jgi:hypothetical protein
LRIGRIIEVKGRAIEARHVGTAAPDRKTGKYDGNDPCGLEAETPASANAKATDHGTHLYSYHPLTVNQLMRGKRRRKDLPRMLK